MQRAGARIFIAVPWLFTLLLVFIGARISVAFGLLALLAGSTIALFMAIRFARALVRLRADIRSGLFDRTERIAELQQLRTALAGTNRELLTRAGAAGSAEQQLLAVIESVTEGIIQVSSSGRFVHANTAARELLNLPVTVTGQAASALIRHPELRQSIEQAAAGQSFEPLEVFFDERQLLVSPRPFRSTSTSGNAGAVIAIVDLTEFRRLEAVRRDFVANVSHELKTPLTSIRGYAETLLSDDVPADMQRQFLEVIGRNVERIQRIVDDLLDLSRLQSGGWQPELQEVDPAALAQDVWAGCDAAHRKQISFEIAADDLSVVVADPAGLRQVFSNLFDNAIRHTPEHGKVSVAIHAHTQFVELAISDTGSGIPRESLPRIFERFYRVDPARSRRDGGTGLGLSIVRHLVDRMNGEVNAESELGRGTTIHIKLPAA